MEELVKEIFNKTVNDLQKAGKLPFPLYYKEVFNRVAYDMNVIDELNPKLLCLQPSLNEIIMEKTQKTLEHISNTSKNLKNNSQMIIEEIEEASPDEIKEEVIRFSVDLIEQINKMENKIQELENELQKAYEELHMDPLTKVYNRKALEKDLKEILEKGKEKDLDLVLAIVDIDDFKSINDKFGHLVGDFVLIKLTQIMKNLLRKSDKIYRFGGDEFIIVFNRSTLLNAQKSIERIVSKISKTALKYKDNLIKITISVGIAQHQKGDTLDSLIKKADEALYEVKKNNKNGYNTFKN
ncbi:GGDEF domain-containing protein [Caminibacter sp.]